MNDRQSDERLMLDCRIRNQRVRLRWWDDLFSQRVDSAARRSLVGRRWMDYIRRLRRENWELRERIKELDHP